uniref:Uncharacterized protein n=1 Tax=Eutreptiella gymnastica TaxID=73025 RepID=A0A7S4G000_9EUGL
MPARLKAVAHATQKKPTGNRELMRNRGYQAASGDPAPATDSGGPRGRSMKVSEIATQGNGRQGFRGDADMPMESAPSMPTSCVVSNSSGYSTVRVRFVLPLSSCHVVSLSKLEAMWAKEEKGTPAAYPFELLSSYGL